MALSNTVFPHERLAGNAYVRGSTNSSDFPTKNAFDNTYGGNSNVFVTKIIKTPYDQDSGVSRSGAIASIKSQL
ncbi:hypothetical protein [Komarekiella delphini-convector]|nr:hypothetical protein [Komarekiella delphini-convector]